MKYVTKVKKQVESTPIYAPIYKIVALEESYDEVKFNAIDDVVNGVKSNTAVKTLFDAINDVKGEYSDIEGMTLACVVKIANDVYVTNYVKPIGVNSTGYNVELLDNDTKKETGVYVNIYKGAVKFVTFD